MLPEQLKLETYRWDAEQCCGCKACIWVDHIYTTGIKYGTRCPSLYHFNFDSYSALGRNKIALGIMDETLKFTDKLLEIIYQCTLCGACDTGCKRNLDLEPLMVIETLRIKAMEKGYTSLTQQKHLADKILSQGNRFGFGQRKAYVFKPRPSYHSTDKIIFFPGCSILYKNLPLARACEGILNAMGISWGLFPDPICCGRPLYSAGMVEQALNIAKENIQKVSSLGCPTIVTPCPECYRTWKVDYPKMVNKSTDEMPYRVLHITEIAWASIQKGLLKPYKRVPLKVAYHDPCGLGRMGENWIRWSGIRGKYGITNPPKSYRRGSKGIYWPPRFVIDSIPGIERKEFIRHRENAFCCGAGGGVLDSFPDFALATAEHRLQEAHDIGVDAVISACPFCMESFSMAIMKKSSPILLYDVAQILYLSIYGGQGIL